LTGCCGLVIMRNGRARDRAFRIPHSAFRIPHSAFRNRPGAAGRSARGYSRDRSPAKVERRLSYEIQFGAGAGVPFPQTRHDVTRIARAAPVRRAQRARGRRGDPGAPSECTAQIPRRRAGGVRLVRDRPARGRRSGRRLLARHLGRKTRSWWWRVGHDKQMFIVLGGVDRDTHPRRTAVRHRVGGGERGVVRALEHKHPLDERRHRRRHRRRLGRRDPARAIGYSNGATTGAGPLPEWVGDWWIRGDALMRDGGLAAWPVVAAGLPLAGAHPRTSARTGTPHALCHCSASSAASSAVRRVVRCGE
jgi:hypothetical protein